MMVMCGHRQVEEMGFSTSSLLLPAMDIKTADGTPAKVMGALLFEISGINHIREEVLSMQLMYCMAGVDNIYMSKECSTPLDILDPDFPQGCVSAGGMLYRTQADASVKSNLEEMNLHVRGSHLGVLPEASDAPKTYLRPKRCKFPAFTFFMDEGIFVIISERQA